MIAVPVAGSHYPRSLGELRWWFATDADCLDYLEWLRWPDGFVCPACGQFGGWRLSDGRFRCAACRSRTSVTAGTIFDRLRGDDPFGLLPGVHRIAPLAKRWLLGTHQGSVDEAHLQSYLDEFVDRACPTRPLPTNRRHPDPRAHGR